MNVNPGIWVRQTLASGPQAFGKTANVGLEIWTFEQIMKEWSKVTGKSGHFIECSSEAYTKLWGEPGVELALQFQFAEMCNPWEETDEFISAEALGIEEAEVVGFQGTIEGLKHLFY